MKTGDFNLIPEYLVMLALASLAAMWTYHYILYPT